MAPRRLASLAIASACLAVGAPLAAQSAATPVVFDTVDAYRVHSQANISGFYLEVTGVQHGAASASTVEVPLGYGNDLYKQGCERILAMSLLHPGRFTVTIVGYSTATAGCSIARR